MSSTRSRSRSPLSGKEVKRRERSRSRSRSHSPYKREEKTIVTKHDHQVYVDTSKIVGAGDGLFARCTIKTGKPVIAYLGAVLTLSQYNILYPNADSQYTLYRRRDGKYVDATCISNSSMGRYANEASGLWKANARYTEAGFIVATKTIHAGDEILVKYGATFHKGYAAKPATSDALSVTTEPPVVKTTETKCAAPYTATDVIASNDTIFGRIQRIACNEAKALFGAALNCTDPEKAKALRAEANAKLEEASKAIGTA